MANDENLKRGTQPGKPKAGPGSKANAVHLTSPGVPLNELKKRALKDENDVREAMRADPMAFYDRIAEDLAVLSHRLLKHANRQKASEMPDRALMDTLRELRQTLAVVNEYRAIRGAAAALDDWFTEVEARLEVAASVLEAGAQPAIDVPA